MLPSKLIKDCKVANRFIRVISFHLSKIKFNLKLKPLMIKTLPINLKPKSIKGDKFCQDLILPIK